MLVPSPLHNFRVRSAGFSPCFAENGLKPALRTRRRETSELETALVSAWHRLRLVGKPRSRDRKTQMRLRHCVESAQHCDAPARSQDAEATPLAIPCPANRAIQTTCRSTKWLLFRQPVHDPSLAAPTLSECPLNRCCSAPHLLPGAPKLCKHSLPGESDHVDSHRDSSCVEATAGKVHRFAPSLNDAFIAVGSQE